LAGSFHVPSIIAGLFAKRSDIKMVPWPSLLSNEIELVAAAMTQAKFGSA